MCTIALVIYAIAASSAYGSQTYHVAQHHPAASDENPGSEAAPWLTISKAASVAEVGDRVLVHEGVYREYVQPRNSGRAGAPIVYEAAEGENVVLTGADVLTGWERLPGERAIYYRPWTVKFIINHVDGKPIYHHPADEKHIRSGRAEQLVVDGETWDYPQLVLSLDDLKPGTFFPDVEHEKLYLWLPDHSDPNMHTIEGCTRGMIFGTNPWARPEGFDYVHVRGFTFRHCATFAQRPAVWMLGKHNLVEDCTIEWMSGGGISVGPKGGVLRRCHIRHCGHTGGCATGTYFTNEDCLWEGNCRKPISRGWDAGGVKICRSHHGLFQRCIFRNNGGPGLWLDIDDANVVIRNCRFEDNEGHGLFIEISRDIYVTDCFFLRNGLRAPEPNWSIGGLCLAESRHCTIVHNLLLGNKDGLNLREQGPRYLDTPDLGNVPFQNVGHVICNNISALNQGYQLGLWYDTAWFGMHPAQRGNYGSEEEFARRFSQEAPDQWFDPLQQGLTIDRNLYFAAEGQKLVLYGCPWRVRHQEFVDLATFTEATGFERAGQVQNPGLIQTDSGWVLPVESVAFQQGFGPRHPTVLPAP
ncbi:MAG: right-handed parallel beta-helix repeat-containing protein [Candidatus Zipacnadales bacterium]